jgi:Endonuclease/Exonuclease/phosphatase family
VYKTVSMPTEAFAASATVTSPEVALAPGVGVAPGLSDSLPIESTRPPVVKSVASMPSGIASPRRRRRRRPSELLPSSKAWIGSTRPKKEVRGDVQKAQAQEMIATLAPIAGPVVLIGDFNSRPGADSYPLLMKAFRDAFTTLSNADPELTCCQAPAI